MSNQQKPRVPVTVLTGFLGAGKTTLLNHLLCLDHGYRCAILVNEFGAVGIDHQLVVGADEEVIELNNGCLCCRVRGDLVRSLTDLFRRRKRFDYVLIETSGLADPGPLCYTFALPELEEVLRLDAIVTVADALHLNRELAETPETARQIAFADLILLNKADLVSEAELDRLSELLQQMNPIAEVITTLRSAVDAKRLFDRKSRDLLAPLRGIPSDTDLKHAASASGCHRDHDPDHVHGPECGHDAAESGEHRLHDEEVGSFSILEERPLDLKRTEAWLSRLLNEDGERIYRSKGILHIKGQPKRVVFQGVQMLHEAEPDRFWHPSERRETRLVFIGRRLDEGAIRRGFEGCIA